MLINPPFEVVGHADIHDFIVPVGEDVDVEVVVFHKVFPLRGPFESLFLSFRAIARNLAQRVEDFSVASLLRNDKRTGAPSK
jgi:hypothetical protein